MINVQREALNHLIIWETQGQSVVSALCKTSCSLSQDDIKPLFNFFSPICFLMQIDVRFKAGN